MRLRQINTISALAVVLFLFAEISLLFFTPRSESFQLFVLYGALFGAFLVLYHEMASIKEAAFLAVVFRLLAWIAFPTLSDDIYRFIWDGNLILDGFSPYLYTPTAFFSHHVYEPFETLYPKLNSSGYYSVYPLVTQIISAFGALASSDLYLSALIIKLPLLIAEITSIWVLPSILIKLKLSAKYSLLYMLNPLIIVDVLANAHFEILVVCFLLMMIQLLQRKAYLKSGICFGLAVASKLLPLLFIPFILKHLYRKNMLHFLLGLSAVIAVSLFPLLEPNHFIHFLSSIELYFNSFEFNASIYFIIRSIGFYFLGYNPIAVVGPSLAVATMIGILILWKNQVSDDLNSMLKSMFWALSVYLFFATTVHPWYIAPLLILGITQRQLFPIVWSGAIFLSYFTYRTELYQESTWIILAEYLLVVISMVYQRQLKRYFHSTLQRL
jgi:uncharacterized membrane protein